MMIMRFFSAVLALAGLALFCSVLSAKDKRGNQERPVMAERLQDADLTDEQEAKITDIRNEFKPKVHEAAKELASVVKDEVEQIKGVLTNEQKEKLEAMKEERKEHGMEGLAERLARLKELDLTEEEHSKIQDIRNQYRPRIAQAMEGLKGILTDDQRKAREEGLSAGKKRMEVLESLNLTGEQKEKVANVCKDVASVVREEMEKIRDVLTEEQQAKLPELKDERREQARDKWACRVANFRDLNLTEEQKTKVEQIRKEFRPKVQEAGNKLRATVREEIGQIVAAIKS
jgi:Spy/CpxP family protein refolding chaperone